MGFVLTIGFILIKISLIRRPNNFLNVEKVPNNDLRESPEYVYKCDDQEPGQLKEIHNGVTYCKITTEMEQHYCSVSTCFKNNPATPYLTVEACEDHMAS